jgi:processing peptidase subunit beta
MVREFHSTYYTGENMVIVGTGNIQHQQLVDLAEAHFSKVPKTSPTPRRSDNKPVFIPALLFIRDDEMVNSNVGVFYDAPSW